MNTHEAFVLDSRLTARYDLINMRSRADLSDFFIVLGYCFFMKMIGFKKSHLSGVFLALSMGATSAAAQSANGNPFDVHEGFLYGTGQASVVAAKGLDQAKKAMAVTLSTKNADFVAGFEAGAKCVQAHMQANGTPLTGKGGDFRQIIAAGEARSTCNETGGRALMRSITPPRKP